MALHPSFPDDPHALLDPAIRWFPADEALREKRADELMPPLVPTLRKEVTAWLVDEASFKKYRPKAFADVVKSFRDYKD